MDWEFVVQEEVGSNRYVPLPEEVRAAVAVDHPLDGPSVHWSVEEHSRYVVLSESPLSEPNYVDAGRFKLYDADDPDRGTRVRPPDRLGPVVTSNFEPGARVVYLAHGEMLAGDNATTYLLSTPQLLELLPKAAQPEAGASADDGIVEALLRTPGLLPPP